MRSLYPKSVEIVLQMYGNLLTKSIRFLPFGVRLRVFWCVTYIEIVHQNTYSTAKSPKCDNSP